MRALENRRTSFKINDLRKKMRFLPVLAFLAMAPVAGAHEEPAAVPCSHTANSITTLHGHRVGVTRFERTRHGRRLAAGHAVVIHEVRVPVCTGCCGWTGIRTHRR